MLKSNVDDRTVIAVTAKSFLARAELCQRLTEECADSSTTLRFAEPERLNEAAYLKAFLLGATHWIVGREPVREDLLAGLNTLKVVSKYGVGLDNIDFNACLKAGVDVRWRPGVNAQAVAEFSLAMMISLCRKLAQGSRHIANGEWQKDGGVAFSGKTLGIVGVGAIGSRVARLARCFGCKLLLCDILDKASLAQDLQAEQVELEDLLRRSDILSLHVPLSEQTRAMIDTRRLALMKPSAYLVNTSRGEVLDQTALKFALQNQQLAGAALDVFVEEPLRDKDLYSLENFIGTAHIGGNSREAVWAMGLAAIDGVKAKGCCHL